MYLDMSFSVNLLIKIKFSNLLTRAFATELFTLRKVIFEGSSFCGFHF